MIRNFAIIAHIDHGKTTLTDRILELAGAVALRNRTDRLMDSNPIEKERGITIKLAPVSFEYTYQGGDARFQGKKYQLNLIDTPGHVDFGYEVSRSLAACEGAILLIDATQGVQAQTLTNFRQAKDLGLKLVPVINKIDLVSADVEKTMLEVMELLEIDDSEVVQISAKTGKNVDQVLQAVVEKIPAPGGNPQADLRALLISSYVDTHRGAIGLVRVVDGVAKANQKLVFHSSRRSFTPSEVGVFAPHLEVRKELKTGQVGYLATGLKDARSLKIGDTITSQAGLDKIVPLPGYKEPLPMVYLEVYPADASQLGLLYDALNKLSLRDAALQFEGTHSVALGNGFRVGFLGILHAEVVLERLKREFSLEVIATPPSVSYEVEMKPRKIDAGVGRKIVVTSPNQMPDPSQVEAVAEPMVRAIIFTPEKYLNSCIQLCRERRGNLLETKPYSSQMQVVCDMPLAEIITDFHDKLKSISSGYASMTYEVVGYVPAEVVKVDVLLNHEAIEALSFLAVKDQAEYRGRRFVERLKEVLPRQMFTVPIQAAIGGRVIARETLQAFRKDVTAKLYGGDVTRRKKLLAKQAKGKKRMKQFGRLELDQQVFIKLLKQ